MIRGIAWFVLIPHLLLGSGIQKEEAVSIGGLRQWISIKGSNEENPVLLFLHGGPGNSVMQYADRFTDQLQKEFVVVLWDQRESGKTLSLNRSNTPLSVNLMISDAAEMISYLRARFSQEKIYLMGHSWGGFLALEMAIQYPQLLRACFALAPMVNQLESERRSLAWMLSSAHEKNNREAVHELEMVKIPFENGDQLYYHRRWLLLSQKKNPFSRSYINRWAVTWLGLFNEASSVNLFEEGAEIKCPVYFFVGKEDRQADSELTEAYYKELKAEKKDLFWFTISAHSLNLTEPKKLQDIVISLRNDT